MSRTAGRLSIHTAVAGVLGMIGVLLAILLYLTALQLRVSGQQTEAETRRTESFKLAEAMRRSSNELSMLVRLYVSTGEPRYRQAFEQVLAIRSGKAPRPLDYDGSYWDRYLAGEPVGRALGPPVALAELMRQAHFTDDEFAALDQSRQASDQLAAIETQVMQALEALPVKPEDPDYLLRVKPLYARLVGPEYYQHKNRIMAAIEHFIGLVDARTLRDVEVLRDHSRHLLWQQIVVLALLVSTSLLAFMLSSRGLLQPLRRLIDVTQRIATGDYAQRIRLRSLREIHQLGDHFNLMAGAIEHDIERRKATELELEKARDAAEAATRAKSTFLATMSHEIRTPMIGVTGMLELLEYSELNNEQRRQVAVVRQSAQSLLTIIGDILDFSKIEAGKLELAPVTVKLGELVEAIALNFIQPASAKGLLLTYDIDSALAPAHVADPVRIRQILSNFLSNALKFTDEGRIDLHLRALCQAGAQGTLQTLEFSVRDTGIGISEDNQKKLFQAFAQADSDTTRRYGGTGLGLTICRRLAELMRGDIRMNSTVGAGTTLFLRLELPVGDPAAAEKIVTTATPAQYRRRPSRDEALREGSLLLLAEDHPTNRLVLSQQFGMAGFFIDLAVDGEEALAMWHQTPYAAVFTDLHMPRMDGYTLATSIRNEEAARGRGRMPVLALTAAALKEDADRCLAVGMDDVVTKPTTVPVLAQKLRQFLPNLDWNAIPAPEKPQLSVQPAAAVSVSVAALDRSVLLELAGGDEAMAATFLVDFLDSTASDVEGLGALVAARDAEGIRRDAHRIKGAARMVGATTLAEAAAAVESAGKAMDWAGIESLAPDIEAAFAELARLRGGRGIPQ